jgi:hypothetical protein
MHGRQAVCAHVAQPLIDNRRRLLRGIVRVHQGIGLREMSGKHQARGRRSERQHGTDTSDNRDASQRFLDMDDRCAFVGPHGQNNGFVDVRAEGSDGRRRHGHDVDTGHCRKPQTQRLNPQTVVSGHRVLLDEPAGHERLHVAVCLAGRQPGHSRNLRECCAASHSTECAQERCANFYHANGLTPAIARRVLDRTRTHRPSNS